MKILVVDDDDIVIGIIESILVHHGHEVMLASNGEEALKVIRENQISIIILDWNMPIMNGIELTRYLRSASDLNFIYIIMVTSRNAREDLLEGLSAGVNDFVNKPIEPMELLLRIKNAEQMLKLETTSLALFSLAKLAESKDTDTGNHLERIRLYSKALGEEICRLKPEHCVKISMPEMLFQTSPLHDIGKVGIPDMVLLKPGSLSDQEWMLMKSHADIGAKTLNEVLDKFPNAEYLRIARDIAWCHHERWDGSGYPRSLQGEEIPIEARIVSLADVYDAVTMKRVYKNALPHEIARGIIVEGSGTHFDPFIVQAFINIEQKFIEIQKSYLDN